MGLGGARALMHGGIFCVVGFTRRLLIPRATKRPTRALAVLFEGTSRYLDLSGGGEHYTLRFVLPC